MADPVDPGEVKLCDSDISMDIDFSEVKLSEDDDPMDIDPVGGDIALSSPINATETKDSSVLKEAIKAGSDCDTPKPDNKALIHTVNKDVKAFDYHDFSTRKTVIYSSLSGIGNFCQSCRLTLKPDRDYEWDTEKGRMVKVEGKQHSNFLISLEHISRHSGKGFCNHCRRPGNVVPLFY